VTPPRDISPCDHLEQGGKVGIRPLVEDDLEWLWHWNVEVVAPEWKQWDGPYFGSDDDCSFAEFAEEWRLGLMSGHRAVVTVGGDRVGFVSRFEEPPAGGGWWEVGIVLFRPTIWGVWRGASSLAFVD